MGDIENRNAFATMRTLKKQSEEIMAIREQLSAMANSIGILQMRFEQLRQENAKELIARLGTGSTVHLNGE